MTTHHHLSTIIIHLLIGGLLGLLSAGFAGHFGWRAADRLPGESVLPQCPFCLRPYEWQEIFPLFGWIVRKPVFLFPCPCAARKGLWAQPIAEITGFALGVASMALMGWNWAALPLIIGLGLLPAIALIDFQLGIIPDGLNLLVAACGLLWVKLSGMGELSMSLVTAAMLLVPGLFFAIVYSRWRGKEMLGLGDVKFFAAAGLWLHPEMAAWFLALGGAVGVVSSLLWRWAGGGKESPFAPALCIALAACVFFQLAHMP